MMPWKDGWMKRNPGLKWPIYGVFILVGLVVLALTFGPDEIRELGRDLLENAGLVSPEPAAPAVVVEPGGVTQ